MPHCWDNFKLSTVSKIFVITSSESLTVFDFKFVAVHCWRCLFTDLEWNFLLKIQKGKVCLQFGNAC